MKNNEYYNQAFLAVFFKLSCFWKMMVKLSVCVSVYEVEIKRVQTWYKCRDEEIKEPGFRLQTGQPNRTRNKKTVIFQPPVCQTHMHIICAQNNCRLHLCSITGFREKTLMGPHTEPGSRNEETGFIWRGWNTHTLVGGLFLNAQVNQHNTHTRSQPASQSFDRHSQPG